MSIAPHGGTLINRELKGREREEAEKKEKGLPALTLSDRELCDLEMIAVGALSPLEGFMNREDYESCLRDMKLQNGLPWAIPVTKSLSEEEKSAIQGKKEITLKNTDGMILAILSIEDVFPHDLKKQAEAVYGTSETAHPGVAEVMRMGKWFVGGKISLLNRPPHADFQSYRLDPKETRKIFEERGWKHIVAFQTRNPIHRAHEYLTKVALECVDGLLIHPLVGQTKKGDIPAEVRMKCYEALLEKYYPEKRTLLSIFPAAMRYAGPREAVWHAIARKNYGCTHFIVGRDHAGANRPDGKPYYGTYDAQLLFDRFSPEEIGIEILRFEHTFFDRKTGGMVSYKTAPRDADPFIVSGTKLRQMLSQGETPPPEITRPEVAQILIAAMHSQTA